MKSAILARINALATERAYMWSQQPYVEWGFYAERIYTITSELAVLWAMRRLELASMR